MDGEWLIKAEAISDFAPVSGAFCRHGDSGEKRIVAQNGRIKTAVPAKKGGNMNITIEFGSDGTADVLAKVPGGRGKWKANIDVSSGTGKKKRMIGIGWCMVEIALTRVQ